MTDEYTDKIHSQLTDMFIDENPRDIAFTRNRRVKTSAGGFTLSPVATLQSQKGRLIKGANRGMATPVVSTSGRISSHSAVIVFSRDKDVEILDTTVVDGMPYRVVGVTMGPWSIEAELEDHAD